MPSRASSVTVQVNAIPESQDKSGTPADRTSSYNGQAVALYIPSAKQFPYILLKSRQITTFGRADPLSTEQPDVDLSLYDAARAGVSRIHVAIELRDDAVVITDLGSTNGTYLNTQLLTANQPYILDDGDEVSLGKLAIKIVFY